MASSSCMIAARSSGVAPVVSRSSTNRALLPPRPGRWKFSCGFTSTPAASNAFTRSMPVVFFERACAAPLARHVGVHVDGEIQRRAAPPVREVRVRAGVEQRLRGVELVVVDREHQRRDAVRRRPVDGLAGGEDRAHAVGAARARGVQQRREPARRAVLRARLARDLRAPVVRGGARAHVGAVLDQQARRARGTRLRRPTSAPSGRATPRAR